MKYIVSVTFPKDKTRYISELNPDFTTACSADFNKAYRFASFEVAWIVAKMKQESYYSMCDVKVISLENEVIF